MSGREKGFVAFIILESLIVIGSFGVFIRQAVIDHHIHAAPIPLASPVAAPALTTLTTQQFTAALDVARVFGRAPGCAEADPKLITDVAEVAVRNELDPRVLAATVAVESACDPYAISSRGALGLTGIMARIWKGSYNFASDYNLLNPKDNLRVGASIESGLIKKYGVTNGLRRYNGLGVGCDTCDAGYPDKITALAARR